MVHAASRVATATAAASDQRAEAPRSALLLEFSELAIPGDEEDQRLFAPGGKFAGIVRFVTLFNVLSTLRVRAKPLIIKACGLGGESLEQLREYLSGPVAERMAAAFDASRLGKLLIERKNRPAIWFPIVRMGSIEGVISLLSGASSQVVSDRIAAAYQLSEYIQSQARREGARDLYSNATKLYAASKAAGIPIVNIVAQRANKGRQGIMVLESERNATRITKMVGGSTALTASTPVLSLSFLKVCVEKKMQAPCILTDLVSVKTGMAGIVASTRPGIITDGLIEFAVREVAAGRLNHPLLTEVSESDLCAQADIDLLRNGADHFRSVEPKTGLLPAPRPQRTESSAPAEAGDVSQGRTRPVAERSWASRVGHYSKGSSSTTDSAVAAAPAAATRASASAIAQTAQSVIAPGVLIQNFIATSVAISKHPAEPSLSRGADGTWRLTIKAKDVLSAFISAQAMKEALAEVGLKAIRATMIEAERAEIIFSEDSVSVPPAQSAIWRQGGNVRNGAGGSKSAEAASGAGRISSVEAPVVAAAAMGQPDSSSAGKQVAPPLGGSGSQSSAPAASVAPAAAAAAAVAVPSVPVGGAPAAVSGAKGASVASVGDGASLPAAITSFVANNPRSGVSAGIRAALARPALVSGFLARAPDSVRVALVEARIIGKSKNGLVELPRDLVDQRTTDINVLHRACWLRQRENRQHPLAAEETGESSSGFSDSPKRFSDTTLREVCEALFVLHQQDILRLHIGREQWEMDGAAQGIIKRFDAATACYYSAGASSAVAADEGVVFSSSSSSSESAGSPSGIEKPIPRTPAATHTVEPAASAVSAGGGAGSWSSPIAGGEWHDEQEQAQRQGSSLPTVVSEVTAAAVLTAVESAGVEESKEDHSLTPSMASAANESTAIKESEGAQPLLVPSAQTPAKASDLSDAPEASNAGPVVLSPPPGEKSLALLDRFVPAIPFAQDRVITEGGLSCATLASLLSRPSLHRVLEDTASMGDDYLEAKFNSHFVHVRAVDRGSSSDERTMAASVLFSAFGGGNPKLQVESERIGSCAVRQLNALELLLPQGHGLKHDNSLSIFLPNSRVATKWPLSRCIVNVEAKANYGHIFEHLAKEIGLLHRGWRLGALPPYFTIFFATPTSRLVFPEELVTTVFDMRKYCSVAVGGPAPVEGTGDDSYRIVSVIYIGKSGGTVCSCNYDPRRSTKQCYIIRDSIGDGRLVDISEASDELEKVKVVSVSFALARL
jgi:hypothetical protein